MKKMINYCDFIQNARFFTNAQFLRIVILPFEYQYTSYKCALYFYASYIW